MFTLYSLQRHVKTLGVRLDNIPKEVMDTFVWEALLSGRGAHSNWSLEQQQQELVKNANSEATSQTY